MGNMYLQHILCRKVEKFKGSNCITTSLNVILLVLAHTCIVFGFLWYSVDAGLLADDATSVFQLNTVTPSQEMIGYVGTSAGYRHSSSQYSAIGQCSVCGLVEAMRVAYLSHCSQLVVLTRGHSLQYSYANLTLVSC